MRSRKLLTPYPFVFSLVYGRNFLNQRQRFLKKSAKPLSSAASQSLPPSKPQIVRPYATDQLESRSCIFCAPSANGAVRDGSRSTALARSAAVCIDDPPPVKITPAGSNSSLPIFLRCASTSLNMSLTRRATMSSILRLGYGAPSTAPCLSCSASSREIRRQNRRH